jgi:hypothetical protein
VEKAGRKIVVDEFPSSEDPRRAGHIYQLKPVLMFIKWFTYLLFLVVKFSQGDRFTSDLSDNTLPSLDFQPQATFATPFSVNSEHLFSRVFKRTCFVTLFQLGRRCRRYKSRVRGRAGRRHTGCQGRRRGWSRSRLVLSSHPFGTEVQSSRCHVV